MRSWVLPTGPPGPEEQAGIRAMLRAVAAAEKWRRNRRTASMWPTGQVKSNQWLPER